MKILYDNIIFSLQKSGGISVVWSELIKRLVDSKKDVSFIEYESAGENIFRKTLTIPQHLVVVYTNFNLRLKRYFNPNIIVTENTIFHSSYYRTIRQPSVANVTSVHDFIYEYYRRGPAKYLHGLQKKYALQNSDLVICVSDSTKKDLLSFFPEMPEKKIKVIHNGVSGDFFQLAESDKPQKLPFSKHSYLLYVGDRRGKYKNFEAIVKCFPAELNLLIAGGGNPNKNEIILLDRYLRRGQYKHTGYVTNNYLNILYNNAKALIYPSSYEGFGIPLLEAQRAGCPVIALRQSSIPEVAGEGAIYLSSINTSTLNNAVEILSNTSFRENLVSCGFKNARKFSWDATYNKTQEAYQEVWKNKFEV